MQKIAVLFLASLTLFPLGKVFAAVPTVAIFPDKVIQGEPAKVTVEGISGAAAVRKISFDGKPVGVFLYQGKPTALIGIDLNKKHGEYKVIVTLADESLLEKIITVGERKKIEAPLGIPKKLGGNTSASQTKLVSSLARENATLTALRTFPRALWTEKFRFPIENPTVTDPYGYLRQTGSYLIPHKGTDFKATEGTPVVAINRGITRLARAFLVYGKTIVVDHGLGLFTFYMHLSKIKVNEGELVKPGQLIGFSGKTGYAENPHLHISVRVQNLSIDPMKFMELFR